jgi:hypothetical protein
MKMIKRKTTTTYEYDKDGNVIKKTIVEEVFEESNPLTYPYNPTPFYYTTTSDQTSNISKTNNTTTLS